MPPKKKLDDTASRPAKAPAAKPPAPSNDDDDVVGPGPASGRVNVYVRVRPPGAKDAAPTKDEGVKTDPDGGNWILLRTGPVEGGVVSGGGPAVSKDKPFVFDGVFDAQSTQKQVYLATAAPILADVLKGFHGCVLAYGQTGAGKTHSMLSSGEAAAADAGIVARVAADLFGKIESDPGREYTVLLSLCQIYNEQIDDMLRGAPQAGGRPGTAAAGTNLAIRKDAGAEWVIDGLNWSECKTREAMLEAIAKGRERLAYAETKMNKHSSRSHAVITLQISHKERPKPRAASADDDDDDVPPPRAVALKGKLTIVDLAGSERVKRSQAAGQALKEATAINASLLAFGNVVSALATKKGHVPFRDSVLTKMLESSLAGDCKTCLLVCVSPDVKSISESVSSLEFASRASNIAVNAKVHSEMLDKLKPKKKKKGAGREMGTQAGSWGGAGGVMGFLSCCCFCFKGKVTPEDDE